MNIAVLGAGAWGSALALHFAHHGHEITLWGHNPEHCEQIIAQGENQRYLAGFTFPSNLSVTPSLEVALDFAQLILIVTPMGGLRMCLENIKALGMGHKPILAACKGFEMGTSLLPHQVCAQILPQNTYIGLLSGPSFAKEVAEQKPCAITLASDNAKWIHELCRSLNSSTMRLYDNNDMIGVAVGGALKNVIAIATGLADGLDYGLNARAALITRGLAEITRFAQTLGADPLTLMGLSGMGDLILTCTGGLSRNRQVGLKLAEGKKLDIILQELGHVAEGVYTIQAAYALAQRMDIEMPITQILLQLIDGEISADTVANQLMMRHQRSEASA